MESALIRWFFMVSVSLFSMILFFPPLVFTPVLFPSLTPFCIHCMFRKFYILKVYFYIIRWSKFRNMLLLVRVQVRRFHLFKLLD